MTPTTDMAKGVAGQLTPPRPGLPSVQRNVLSNWTSTAANIAYSLCITPIVVGALDKDLYGVWSFLNGLLAYSNLFYLGLGSALIRYASQYTASGNQPAINRLSSVVLSLYGSMGGLCVAGSLVIAPIVPSLLAVVPPPGSSQAIAITCVLLGVRVLLMFVGSVFSGLLVAEGRADIFNSVQLAGTAGRFVAVPMLLGTGNPLLTLAVIVTASAALETLALARLAHVVDPALRNRPALPQLAELRLLYGFGLLSFLIQLSERLISYTDTTVIGLVLGAVSVTLYSLPLQLAEYARIAVWGIVSVLLPYLTTLHTHGDIAGLRKAYLRTTRVCCFVSAFANINLIFLGRPFLTLWVGRQFADAATWVLPFLACASFFQALSIQAQIPFYQTMRLMRFPVVVLGFEALANLVLSIYLGRRIGIAGVALGTVIPSCLISFALLPRYVCRRLGVPYRQLLIGTLLPAAILATVTGGLHIALNAIVASSSYLMLVVKALATVPVALAVVVVTFPGEDRSLAVSGVRTVLNRVGLGRGSSRTL